MPTRAFFERPAREVAPELLGAVLTRTTPEGSVGVRLTEVEAYEGRGEDPGSHAHRSRTERNSVMFGPAGRIYAYFTYGMHTCANITCQPPGRAAAVLLRAGEVVAGIELARARRPTARRDVDLARGPARLDVALGITLADGGQDLLAGGAFSIELASEAVVVLQGPRVGVAGEGGTDAFPWRFRIEGDPTVSAYRAAVRRRR